MSITKLPEVLAPAGDLSRLKAAVNFGADAVYIGGKIFGMRATPLNFTFEQMKEGVEYAHKRGVKVYITLNTLPTNEEMRKLPEFLPYIKDAGIDAVIVTDMGVMAAVKDILPEMEMHISTQAGVVNYASATALYNMGAKRVVLARELNIYDIADIRANTPKDLEIEAFVHGAMCMSFSGRCLLSSYIVNRDANRGECAQPCRWRYHLVEEKRPGEYYQIGEDEFGSYILNAKDMCMIEHIPELVKAGISSFKIEGRAKSEYYAAVITNAYRLAMDAYGQNPEDYRVEDWLVEEVKKVSHREYTTGFYFGTPDNGQCYETGGYVRKYDIVAVVDYCEDGVVYCTQRNKFFPMDTVEILSPKSKPYEINVGDLYDENGEKIEHTAHSMMKFSFKYQGDIAKGSIIRKGIEK